ncbi:MAG: hypothetical protein HY912_02180 [Desulfomonile tiedjei]|uniref:Acyl dehydratase n=1 Tax=Desulfomonile tiedjei TaxID=2358 RepID=A0A9D6Z207_9BACT|nr:hypothetical protein [Desulfomonile tiedjei]
MGEIETTSDLNRHADTDTSLRFRFGPVSPQTALALAQLAKDYNPLFLVAEIAEEAGIPDVRLHPLWVSGFADSAVRRIANGGLVTDFTIRYHRSASHGQVLTFQFSLDPAEKIDHVLAFKVVDLTRRLVATGSARVKSTG